MRTLTAAAANNGATFPQTPMQIKLGTWDGGASTEPQGTITWAGGLTPFDDNNGPYKAYYKTIKIVNKSNGVANATSYTYEGTSGTYENIKVNTGDISTLTASKSSSKSSTATTGTATGTATGKTTSTGTASKATSMVTATTSTGKSGTAKSTATGTSASASGTSGATTSGAGKVSMTIFGAASALLAAVALL